MTDIQKKDEYCHQILLKPETVEALIQVNDLEPALQVVDQILKANRNSAAAEEYHKKSQEGKDDWTLQDGLLLKGN